MSQTLSERAQRFLGTFERAPYVDDLGLLRDRLEESGVPVTEPVLDFQRTFAGYVGLEEGMLGIIHPAGASLGWVEPMKVDGFFRGKESRLTCADCHPSDAVTIALDGTIYRDWPVSANYFLWTERCGLQHEFFETRGARVLNTAAAVEWLAAVFLPRLGGYRIDALSDEYCELFATDDFVVSVVHGWQQYHVMAAKGSLAPELADFQRPYSVADKELGRTNG